MEGERQEEEKIGKIAESKIEALPPSVGKGGACTSFAREA